MPKYQPSLEEFLGLANKHNLIPVYKEINADLDTPVSAYLKFKRGDYSFLLESVEGQEKVARYSFLGNNPHLVIKTSGRRIQFIYPDKRLARSFLTKSTPLDEIRKLMQGFNAASVKGLPRFFGGLVGYIGYDMVRFFENIPDKNPDELQACDSLLFFTDTILIFDHVNHSIKIVNNVLVPVKKNRKKLEQIYTRATKKLDLLERELGYAVAAKQLKPASLSVKPESNVTKKQFEDMVARAKGYIKKGDIIQVVLSQRFSAQIKKNPFDIYRSLRSLNPSPYMFFLKAKDFMLAGASPEMLVRCENRKVQTRPIAGTRPRGRTQEEDSRLEAELLKDKKEKAEHIMLVDLGRNDLGRVCRPGKVQVSEFMRVERYSHVMHLVSEVEGALSNKYDIYDVLKACFPAGTVSGSPKIRAMQIIDELENTRRGPYAGCVGYFSFSHNMDTCITIRTVVIKGNKAYVQAGAGIVADSVPVKEYYETINKAKALMEAINN